MKITESNYPLTCQLFKIRNLAIILALIFLNGCYSVGKKVGELRASIYAPIYEAEFSIFSEKAEDEALEYCLNEFKDKKEFVEKNPDIAKECLETQFTTRMNYYMSQSITNRSQSQSSITAQPSQGQKIYSSDECIGAVVNGVCHGSIAPKPGYKKTCYGQMINGQCTGAMF